MNGRRLLILLATAAVAGVGCLVPARSGPAPVVVGAPPPRQEWRGAPPPPPPRQEWRGAPPAVPPGQIRREEVHERNAERREDHRERKDERHEDHDRRKDEHKHDKDKHGHGHDDDH